MQKTNSKITVTIIHHISSLFKDPSQASFPVSPQLLGSCSGAQVVPFLLNLWPNVQLSPRPCLTMLQLH